MTIAEQVMESENGARLGSEAKGGELSAISSALFEPVPDSQVSINSAFDQLFDKFSISLVLKCTCEAGTRARLRKIEAVLVKA